MKNRYNIVVLGKTGVGKSSLINYLYGEDIVKTGVGNPVTEKGFHHIDYNLKELPIRIFDSWGLEAGKADEWKGELEEALEERGVNKPAEDWFHSIFYCISCGGHRVEPFEIDVIKKFINEKYPVTIILTNSDLTTQKDLDSLRKNIEENIKIKLPIIPVCSVEQTLIGGQKTEPFGKKEIEGQTYINFWHSLVSRLPDRCEEILINEISEWKRIQENYICDRINILNTFIIQTKLASRTEIFVKKLNKMDIVLEEVSKTANLFKFFADSLQYPPISGDTLVGKIKIEFPEKGESPFSGWDILLLPLMPVLYLLSIPTSPRPTKENLLEALNQTFESMIKETKKMKPIIEEAIRSIRVEVNAK